MIVHHSALIAILLNQPEAAEIIAAIETAPRRMALPTCVLETHLALVAAKTIEPEAGAEIMDRLITTAGIHLVSVTPEMTREALGAAALYPRLTVADAVAVAAGRSWRTTIMRTADASKRFPAGAMTPPLKTV